MKMWGRMKVTNKAERIITASISDGLLKFSACALNVPTSEHYSLTLQVGSST